MGRITLLITQLFEPMVPSNMVVHLGQVITVSPILIRIGSTVITPDGLGEVKSVIPDWVNKNPDKVDVYLYKGYVKRYRILLLQQYVILHKPTGQFVRLSPQNYQYIYKEKQLVEYRVTKRLYAQMTEKSKTEYAYAKSLNKQRGGLRFLRILGNQNLEIKKK